MKVSEVWFGKMVLAPVLVLFLLLVQYSAQAQFTVSTNSDGTLNIVQYTDHSSVVVIPSSIGGRTVTGIGQLAFNVFPSPTSISIPASVTNIMPYALAYSSGLRTITVSAQNPAYTVVNNVLFSKSQDTLVVYPDGLSGTYTIPTTVKTIATTAFAGASGLTSVTVPSTVTNIGYLAFPYCTHLASITVDPANPYYLSSNGVLYDKTQTRLLACPGGFTGTCPVPASVQMIDYGAFVEDTNLTAISVDPQNAFYTSVDGVLFDHSQTMLIQFPGAKSGSYVIPPSVINIQFGAFQYAMAVTNVVISDGVVDIPSAEFESCKALQSVSIGGGVTNIESIAFAGDTSLVDVSIGTNVSQIGAGAFEACYQLGRVVIPTGVTNISTGAFQGCISLLSLDFLGSAPPQDPNPYVFNGSKVTIYYLPGTSGWGTIYDGRPAVLWNPVLQTGDGGFGVQNNAFGFNVTGNTNVVVVVEAAADAGSSAWTPVATNSLTGGAYYFNDPQWVNHPGRFYRLRMP